MQGLFFILLFGLFLATTGIFVNLNSGIINGFVLSFYRALFAALILITIAPFFDKKMFKITKRDLLSFISIGFIFALSMILTIYSYSIAPVNNIALIWSVYPFFVFIFAYFMLKEKITKTKIITLIIALVGIAIITPITPSGLLGSLLALFAAALDGFLFTLIKKEGASHGLGDVFWFFLFATIFLLSFPLTLGFGEFHYSAIGIGVCTGLAFLFYNIGLKYMEVDLASIIDIIAYPLFTIIMALFILHEPIKINIIIGGTILIGAAIYLEKSLKVTKK